MHLHFYAFFHERAIVSELVVSTPHSHLIFYCLLLVVLPLLTKDMLPASLVGLLSASTYLRMSVPNQATEACVSIVVVSAET